MRSSILVVNPGMAIMRLASAFLKVGMAGHEKATWNHLTRSASLRCAITVPAVAVEGGGCVTVGGGGMA